MEHIVRGGQINPQKLCKQAHTHNQQHVCTKINIAIYLAIRFIIRVAM